MSSARCIIYSRAGFWRGTRTARFRYVCVYARAQVSHTRVLLTAKVAEETAYSSKVVHSASSASRGNASMSSSSSSARAPAAPPAQMPSSVVRVRMRACARGVTWCLQTRTVTAANDKSVRARSRDCSSHVCALVRLS
jgi:hypothetical protein